MLKFLLPENQSYEKPNFQNLLAKFIFAKYPVPQTYARKCAESPLGQRDYAACHRFRPLVGVLVAES